jgi:lipopolysaccharide/colanic/teichoic acid biosynthesis glycosyltransferase
MTAKRSFDLFVTIVASVTWIPALLLTALVMLVREGRPIFYVSPRIVGPGKIRRVVKFRTMVRDAERVYNRSTVPVRSDGVRFLNLPPDSELYTSTGRLIERLAFTELPQLLLVLRGDMSLVGSRPLPESVTESLRERHPRVDERLRTPAAMTGPVQLIGRERLSDEDRLDLEATYCRIASQSTTWTLDFLILLFTVLAALRLRHPMTVAQVKEFMLGHSRERRQAARAARDAAGEVRRAELANADGDLPSVVLESGAGTLDSIAGGEYVLPQRKVKAKHAEAVAPHQ